MKPGFQEHIARDGFAIVNEVIGDTDVQALRDALEGAVDHAAVRSRGGVFAIRNLLDLVPQVRQLAESPRVRSMATSVLGPDCFPVRGILFDKTPSANWLVPWHQDLTIAVRCRRDAPGFGPWSKKAGVPHVQPPVKVLHRMLSIRVHLDDCGESSGPLRVFAGSHLEGRLSPNQIALWQTRSRPVICVVASGGVLAMRPLLLHASSEARSPGHRRVVHLDFATGTLPGGLDWRRPVTSFQAQDRALPSLLKCSC